MEVRLNTDSRESVLPDPEVFLLFNPQITILHILDEADSVFVLRKIWVSIHDVLVSDEVELDETS